MRIRKTNCDILNLEWASKGRDIDIVEPVLSYLELKHPGLRIVRESIADFEWKLIKYSPKLLLLSDSRGGGENFQAAKLAHHLGIKVASLMAEGDYAETPEGVREFFWQWNKEQVCYDDLHLEWSQRTLDLIHRHIPESQYMNIQVSGATGFDRYRFFHFIDKRDFLRKYHKEHYRKVVGLAGWSFDKFIGAYYEKFRNNINRVYSPSDIEIHQNSKDRLHDIYGRLISANPDILFVLKFHPGTVEERNSEFYNLDQFENTVKIIKEENIADVISASDLWIAYESTTALEAWLMKKTTLLVNPVSDRFSRSRISGGSPIIRNADELIAAVSEFYLNNSITSFHNLENRRGSIIRDIIQWGDGYNHVRAGDMINDLLMSHEKETQYRSYRYIAGMIARYAIRKMITRTPLKLIPPFRNLSRYHDRFQTIYSPQERGLVKQHYTELLSQFDINKL